MSGMYPVQTSYSLALEVAERSRHSSSSAASTVESSRFIWVVSCTSRCREVAWRCYKSVLSVRDLLHKRGIVQDKVCLVYGLEDETIHHVILSCPQAQAIWFASSTMRACT